MSPLDELATILRPAGAGLFLVSTGRAEQEALQQRLYGATSPAEVRQRFRDTLEKIPTAKGVLIAVPSDVGAGFRRGANLGPQAIRLQLIADEFELASRGVLDLGDVFVVPQLLSDEMLSADQLTASRRAVYPDLPEEVRATLPVAPLSIERRAFELVFQLNPKAKPFVIGGDHSTALPAVQALAAVAPQPWGIVQPDAHTDLLETRLGIKHCFATWSWHANELIGRKGRLTQVGIRASGRDRAHWESTLDVRQFWAKDVLADPEGQLDALIAHVKSTGVRGVYFSNDIDGTDAKWADATGTPEYGGLEPEWVVELIRRLGREVGLLGGDIMEVAPSLTPTPESAPRTVGLAARYLRETVDAALPK
ncbi:MAG: arginase family protein [Archangium sp.]|nr:arginase family protein [Archangium sp.]MDP3156976.1 arginase family protein [Archangium sp.]MDP3574757.1 arginase family protein [Archangium sp.]